MTDRLGLLRAILANPADDLPRLVFADWLEENGTTDADAARAELIRLWFRLKPGLRTSTKTIAAWLTKNWPRLWPATAAALGSDGGGRAQGRCLTVSVAGLTSIKVYFQRGFAEQVLFGRDEGFRRFWRSVATDEPLATIEPHGVHCRGEWPAIESVVEADFWGEDVYARVTGFDLLRDGKTKVFSSHTGSIESDRDRNAIRAAMTTLAREANGLTPPPTESA